MDIQTISNWLGTGSINVFGRPFAGKDTVCKKLADKFDGIVLGGGDIFRNTVIPEHVKRIIEAGNLAPTQDFIDIVVPYLSKQEFEDSPLILSSVGRWIGEEGGVLRAARESGHPLRAIIYLDISDTAAHNRLTRSLSSGDRARVDDHPEILEKRFKEFTTKTLPVIDEYEKLGLLIRIDGMQSPEVVFQTIVDELANRASASR